MSLVKKIQIKQILDIIKKYGIDQLRYYLIKEVSLGNDGSISLKSLKDCINNDLANTIGNLLNRTSSMSRKWFNNKVPIKEKNSSEANLNTANGFNICAPIQYL